MGFKQFDLSGKVALVTGGNSGIGLGMANGLVEAGASVCIWGTNQEKNAAAKNVLKSLGGQAAAIQCDVSEEGQVKKAFQET